MCGTSMASLKVNSTKSKPSLAIKDDIQIPSKIYKNNSNIKLWIDVFYINDVSFMLSIDIQLKYRSIIHITYQNEEEFSKGLDKILWNYNSSGFTITIIHTYYSFKPLMDNVKDDLDVTMNYANPGDHIPEIERNNRTVK